MDTTDFSEISVYSMGLIFLLRIIIRWELWMQSVGFDWCGPCDSIRSPLAQASALAFSHSVREFGQLEVLGLRQQLVEAVETRRQQQTHAPCSHSTCKLSKCTVQYTMCLSCARRYSQQKWTQCSIGLDSTYRIRKTLPTASRRRARRRRAESSGRTRRARRRDRWSNSVSARRASPRRRRGTDVRVATRDICSDTQSRRVALRSASRHTSLSAIGRLIDVSRVGASISQNRSAPAADWHLRPLSTNANSVHSDVH